MLFNGPIKPAGTGFNRRWISDEYFDLIVWYETGGQVHGFQLCYDKPGHERALTWVRERGFKHSAIDTGESMPTANCTPILVADGAFPFDLVRLEFISRSKQLPEEIRDLVCTGINEYEKSLARS